jgi:hypothetical protein
MTPKRKSRLTEKRKKLCLTLGRISMDLIRGSLVIGKKKCGRKGCSCNEGKLHRHVVISTQRGGKSHIVYVSRDNDSQAANSISAYNKAWKLIEDISRINLELFKAGALSGAKREKGGK